MSGESKGVSASSVEIFAVCLPGLEAVLAEEVRELGLGKPKIVAGGVMFRGLWPTVWRANLSLRGASRVLVRIGELKAPHLSALEEDARRLAWNAFLRPDVPVRVEASCIRSKIYHSGAAAERIGKAITAVTGAPVIDEAAALKVMVRIDRNICTVSVDTSGELLHRRGFKQAVGKAPLRETQAALFLRACGYDGKETVVDPMCGSGTFPIEAAEWAAGLMPGRARSFAFENLGSFDPEAWQALKTEAQGTMPDGIIAYGYDRNEGAVRMAAANAERAGVGGITTFAQQNVSELKAPDGSPGLVMVNPPYGARIGDRASLRSLYQTLGRVLMEGFRGWRVGLVTSDDQLARATGLPFGPPGQPVPHGPLRIRLWRTGPL